MSPAGGDGVLTPYIACNVQLPDTATTIPVGGSYQAPRIGASTPGVQPYVPFTGSPITPPSVPGSGSIYWNCVLNTSTGALTVTQSTSAYPTPAAGTIILFQQTLPSTAPAGVSLQGGFAFPWL
jgi:hypothetical protein